MQIKSFRIKNYRSIKDSGSCYLSGDNITILAGMNESGKTAILEALEDFKSNKDIRKEAIHIHSKEAKPEIAVIFEIDKEELNEIFNEINIEAKSTKSLNVEIIKKYPGDYSLSEESLITLGITDEQLFKIMKKVLTDTYKQIKTIHSEFPVGATLPKTNFDDIQDFQNQLIKYRKQTQPNLATITDEEKRDEFVKALDDAINKINEIRNLGSVKERFIDKLKTRIPNFILFSSFDDIFPSEVPLDEAPDNKLIKDLAIISDLDLKLITSGLPMHKTKHKEQLNVRLKEDYKEFWTQDLTNLHIDWDSEKLYFFIKEDEDFYSPNMRSKGKQWHLAFYVRVSARARENVSNIILIDEPGLFLHAKAQKDVLKKLEDCAEDAPIIFSTHSPFLIDVDKLSRIRLISRDLKKGTLISNKIHKGADEDTLTPIITAIGLDLSMGLDIAKDNNIIVEGITDYYYLSAFIYLLNFKFKKEIHFIPSVGADKFNFLVPLMIGWGFNYCVILDNDRKGKQIEKKLSKDFGHTGIKTKFVSGNLEEEIEDLFDREDFVKYVLNDEVGEVQTDEKNSQLIKRGEYDKVLLSKLFFEKIKKGDIAISEVTKKNFESLLTEIDNMMFS